MQSIAIVNAMLAAAAPVTALVASRIYPLELPQGCAMPALVLFHGDDVPQPTIDATGGFNLRRVPVSVYVLASNPADLAAVQIAAENACKLQRGLWAGYYVNETDVPVVAQPEWDSTLNVWKLALNFNMTYQR